MDCDETPRPGPLPDDAEPWEPEPEDLEPGGPVPAGPARPLFAEDGVADLMLPSPSPPG